MKTMYDSRNGCILICSKPTRDPALYIAVETIWMYIQAGTYSSMNDYQNREFYDKPESVGITAEYILDTHKDLIERVQQPLDFYTKNNLFSINDSIDVTGYSLARLEQVIIDSVDELEKEFADLVNHEKEEGKLIC